MGLDEDTLSKILSSPTKGIRSIKSGEGIAEFLKICGVLDDSNTKYFDKRALKGEFQFLFELVIRALLTRSKTKFVTGPNLYLTKVLFVYQRVNLRAIVMEHINTVMTTKD